MSAQTMPSQQQLSTVLAAACEAVECRLVDHQLTGSSAGGAMLRVFIERADIDQVVAMSDIVAATHQIKATIAVAEHLPQNFRLEVSSPGVERPLKAIADYQRFVGKAVKLYLRDNAAVDTWPEKLQKQRQLSGVLGGVTECEPYQVILEVDGETCYVSYADINKAHLLLSL